MSRLPVRKTYKLFIGGGFPRSESGRSYEAEGRNVACASRKDLRDAVTAARTAQPGWAAATPFKSVTTSRHRSACNSPAARSTPSSAPRA